MTDVFSTVAASEGKSWTMDGGSEPVRVLGKSHHRFLSGLRRKAVRRSILRGRRKNTVVLSHKFWQSQFGGDLSAIGRSIILDGQLHKIIGIAGPGFQFAADSQIWTALYLSPERLQRRGNNMILNLLVRLKDGVSPAFAAERVNRYVAAMKANSPDSGYFVDLTPFDEFIAGDLRRPLFLLWAAALVVLLTGCANIATLLLSRTAGRKRRWQSAFHSAQPAFRSSDNCSSKVCV